ncbi:CD276 antigen-like [Anneissia japonica]|uniref:CD276 antigen-like n=1 Tax=Anneissia japonica TaxID=1529436 RepID=UPI0014257557|nr:CD276 antigen-like [Anneissia japonica]
MATLVVPFLLFLLSFESTANVINQPEDITAEVGDTVILRCTVETGSKVNVYWQTVTGDSVNYLTDNTRIYPGTDANSINERIEVVGDAKSGVFNLKIKPIIGSDSGKFLCLYFVDGIHQTSSRVATLTVLSPPFEEYPICSLTPKNDIKIGDFVRMTCVTSGGIPPAKIYWKRFEEILPAYRLEQDGRTYISYEFTLSELDNGAVFTCDAESPAIKTPRFCSVRPYRSETSVRIQSRSTPLVDGKDGVFDCIASAIPTADVFEWRLNNLPLDNDRYKLENDNQTLRISPLGSSDNDNVISCTAGNTYVVVTGNASISLSLTKIAAVDGPEIVGISVGIIVGIILAIVMVIFLLKYKRKRDFFKDLDFNKACRNSYVFPRQFFSRRSANEVYEVERENDRPDSIVIVCSTPQEAINIHSNQQHRIPQNDDEARNPRYSVGFYMSNCPTNNERTKSESERIYNDVEEEDEDETQATSEAIYSNIDEVDKNEQRRGDPSTPPKPPPQSLKPRISGPILNYSTNNSVDLANAIFVGIIDQPY